MSTNETSTVSTAPPQHLTTVNLKYLSHSVLFIFRDSSFQYPSNNVISDVLFSVSMKNYFDSEPKVLLEATPFNTKNTPTSKQLTSDCSVAGRKQNLFTDLPKGPKNPYPQWYQRVFFIFPRMRQPIRLCTALLRQSLACRVKSIRKTSAWDQGRRILYITFR